jgi:predicted nucleic acid-binding protein
MNEVVLDTDVSSQILKRRFDHPAARRVRGMTWYVTFVTAGELWEWAQPRRGRSGSRVTVERWLRTVTVLDSDATTSRNWGSISAHASRRGRPRPDNDTWIAACCLTHQLPLATGNVKDFADYVDHEGLRLVTA